ncbi:hypothetical protein EW093_08660 [Thiospirochaeta perfilievii]|uniref:Uncharacterized protein n=1 Tax=Thiospirochaeta perfilievii TaxID=252967 RepID=A0A5C1QB76_9SPIO|nr:hypothetical protein [Thiospirochaeta perfilievii]QEN04771.1 hypothetical protein EW093_08660 [Thiospirochaeta perfilievii]
MNNSGFILRVILNASLSTKNFDNKRYNIQFTSVFMIISVVDLFLVTKMKINWLNIKNSPFVSYIKYLDIYKN